MDMPLSPEQLRQFEWRIRQVYLALSERVDLAEEIRFFCHCMAEDERRDIGMLDESCRLRTSQATPRIPEEDLIDVEKRVATAEGLAAQMVLSANDVLRLALHIEGSTLHRLDRLWLDHFSEAFGSFLQMLASDPEIRIRRLIEAIHAFGTDPNLRDEVAPLWMSH